MTDGLVVAAGGALWLGLLTSISPCPLATNIAAIGYIGRRVERPSLTLAAGLLYVLGRMLAYTIVAMITVGGLTSTPALSGFLQRHMNQALGPILIVSGLLLLDVIPWPWRGSGVSEGFARRIDRLGIVGAAPLGAAFALAFCPVSAALFFGSLIPLALRQQSAVLAPMVYGLGTALPTAVFSFILAFAAHRLSRAFNLLTAAETWLRRATAALFVGVGGYYLLAYTFGIL